MASCDKAKHAQKFIAETTEVLLIFNDCAELGSLFGFDVKSKKSAVVPCCDTIYAGWLCDDHSQYNNKSKNHRDSLEDPHSQGKSAKSFNDLVAFIEASIATFLILENVPALVVQLAWRLSGLIAL